MGSFHDIQPTFAGGELTPAMYSRVDMAKYKTALKTARNGVIHPQGGFSARPGFYYVAAAKYADKKCRLIPFKFSSEQSYILEFGDGYIRFYRNGTVIVTTDTLETWGGMSLNYSPGDEVQYNGIIYRWYGGESGLSGNQNLEVAGNHDTGDGWQTVGPISSTPYEVATTFTEDELDDIKYTQSADTLYLAHPDHAPQTLVRDGDADWTLSAFPFICGPYKVENADIASTMYLYYTTGSGSLTASKNTFSSSDIGKWFRISLRRNASTYQSVLTNGSVLLTSFGYKQWKVSTTGTWSGTLSIQILRGDNDWLTIATLTSSNNSNYDTYGDIPYDYPVLMRISASISGSVTVIATIDSFVYPANVQISSYSSETVVGVTMSPDFGGYFLQINHTSEWAEGAWSILNGWPSVVAFYQDRLVFASTPTSPQSEWMSQTSNYVNFGVSDPLVDSDAISVDLPSRQLNAVQNLVPLTNLLALTNSGEFSIGPGSSGVLSPTSINQRPQGYRGSSSVNVLVIGNHGIYVQPRGTIVRNIAYDYASDSFTGNNLSIMSEHLFRTYSITDMAYCAEPDSIAYLVRSDGVLLVLTYLPEQQVIAWTHFDTTGTFESCASIPTTGYDELWVVVNRTNGRFIERMADLMPTTATKDQFHVDCGIDYDGAAVTGISGLDHLEGQSVITLADGCVQGPFTVVDGAITLTTAASLVHIGLAYTVDMETLNVELAGQDGTSQGRKKRTAQLTVRFLNSLGGYWGPDSTHLREIPQDPPATLGSARTLFSGDRRAPITPSWECDGRIFLRQTDPLPFNVTGVFPVVESGNL